MVFRVTWVSTRYGGEVRQCRATQLRVVFSIPMNLVPLVQKGKESYNTCVAFFVKVCVCLGLLCSNLNFRDVKFGVSILWRPSQMAMQNDVNQQFCKGGHTVLWSAALFSRSWKVEGFDMECGLCAAVQWCVLSVDILVTVACVFKLSQPLV